MEKLNEFWLTYRRWIIAGAAILAGLILLWSQLKSTNSTSDQFMGSTASRVSHSKTGSSARGGKYIYVDIKGAVAHPGVIRLMSGSRVEEALKVAQPTSEADLKQVNLAKQLSDQQMLYVPKQGEQIATNDSADDQNANGSEEKTINLNTAGKEQLCQITGIGDKKADLIIQYRQEHGQFKTVDELKNINGFGDKTVAKLKPQLAV